MTNKIVMAYRFDIYILFIALQQLLFGHVQAQELSQIVNEKCSDTKIKENQTFSGSATCMKPIIGAHPGNGTVNNTAKNSLDIAGQVVSKNLYQEISEMKLQKSIIADFVNASVYGVNGKYYDFTKNNPNAIKDAMELYRKSNPNFLKLPEKERTKIAKIIGKSIAEYRRITKNIQPQKFNSASFNEKLIKINTYCGEINKKYKNYFHSGNPTKDRDGFLKDANLDSPAPKRPTKPTSQMSTRELAMNGTDFVQHSDAYQNANISRVNDIASKLVSDKADMASLQKEPDMQNALRNLLDSPYGGIVLTDHFTQNVGSLKEDFVRKTCQKGDGKIFNTKDQKQLYTAARELQEKVNDEVKKNSDDILVSDPKSQQTKLKEYMDENPLVLAAILNKNRNPDEYKKACDLAKACIFENKVKKVVVGTAFFAANIALGAVTGGIGPTILLSLGAAGVETLYDRHTINVSQERTQLLGITNQIDRTAATKKVGALEETKPTLKDFAKTVDTDLLIQVATHGAGKLLKNAESMGSTLAKTGDGISDVSTLARSESNFVSESSKAASKLDDVIQNVGQNSNTTRVVGDKINTGLGSTYSDAQKILPDVNGSRMNKIAHAIEKQETSLLPNQKTSMYVSDQALDKMGQNVSRSTATESRVGAAFNSQIRNDSKVVNKGIIVREKDALSQTPTVETKHEIRHWKFENERLKGRDTAFDGSIESRLENGHISEYHNGAYSNYQSLEEVSTHSKDLASTVKRVKDPKVQINVADSDVAHFQDRAYNLKEISEQTLSTKKEVMQTITDFKSGRQSFTDRSSNIALQDLNGTPVVEIQTEKYSMKVKMPTAKDKKLFSEYEDINKKLDIHENGFGIGKKLSADKTASAQVRKKEIESYFIDRAETKLTDTYGQTKKTYDRLRRAVEKSDELTAKGVVSGKEYNQFVDDVRSVSSVEMKVQPRKIENGIHPYEVVTNPNASVASDIEVTTNLENLSIVEKEAAKKKITEDWKKLTDKEIGLKEEKNIIKNKLEGNYQSEQAIHYQTQLKEFDNSRTNLERDIQKVEDKIEILNQNRNLTIGQKVEQRAALIKEKETISNQIKGIDDNRKNTVERLAAETKVNPEAMQNRLKNIDDELGKIKTKGEEYSKRLKETELSGSQKKLVEQQDNIAEVTRLEMRLANQKEQLIDHKSSLLFKNEDIRKAKIRNNASDTEEYTFEHFTKGHNGKWVSPTRQKNIRKAIQNERDAVAHYQKIEDDIPKIKEDIEKTTQQLREVKLKRANQYFNEELNETQLKTFDKFKKEVRFDEMNVADKEDLLLKMHTIHEKNNGINKVLMDKKRDLVDLQEGLKARLIDAGQDPIKAEKIAKLQVRALASKENKILGANPLQYEQRFTDDLLPDLKKEFKTNPSGAVSLKSDYRELLEKRNSILKEYATDPNAKKSIREIDKDIANIEIIYPKKAELDQIKIDYRNGKSAEIKATQQAREAERIKSETKEKLAKEVQEKEKQIKLAEQKAIELENRKTLFQNKNTTYSDVKNNYNATDMHEWSSLMRENNIAPSATEMDNFVKDAQRYLRKTKGDAKIETAENVVAVLSNSKITSKSTDIDSFTSFIEMIKDPKMPSQSKIVEAMDKHFDYAALGKKLNANQLSDLRSIADYSKDEATRSAAKDILIKMNKYFNQ